MFIVIPRKSTKNEQKYIVKEKARELKWYTRKHLLNTQKKMSM